MSRLSLNPLAPSAVPTLRTRTLLIRIQWVVEDFAGSHRTARKRLALHIVSFRIIVRIVEGVWDGTTSALLNGEYFNEFFWKKSRVFSEFSDAGDAIFPYTPQYY